MTRFHWTLALHLCLISPLAAESDKLEFAKQILPILSDKCFVCHGPDAKKSELRLDSFEAATQDLGGYKAIDPKNLEDSEVLIRIHDKEDPMPPKKAEKMLTDSERELLSQWVKQGAEYSKHWAYVVPKRESNQAIDSLVKAGFPKGVDFAPRADLATLGRRAALVLTGLPPEQEQLARLLSSKNYEAFVDELLASPRYGEHRARYWLDAVRYGDTHGLHLDNKRGIFPYRDWVIKAYNENLPVNKFLTWQLAGDLLPNPSLEQQVATGFVRMNPTTSEGGAIAAEFQAKNNFDRVETLGTALLGASLVCARCHTHKYDPITHKEYYELMAFFNSTAESPLDGNSYVYGPNVKAPSSVADWQKWEQLEEQRAALIKKADLSRLPEAIQFAKSTLSWKSSDWKMSKPAPLNAKAPAEKQFVAAKGFPGRTGRLPRANQAIWISFKLESPTTQTLILHLSSGAGHQVFVNGDPVASKSLPTSVRVLKGSHQFLLKLVGMNGKNPIEVRFTNPWEKLAKTGKWEACSDDEKLYMLSAVESPLGDGKSTRAAAEEIAQKSKAIQSKFTTTLVAKDLPKPRETRVLDRGEYHLPIGDPLKPGVFSIMGGFPDGAPGNRLGLAKWLLSDEHPLVTRVLINRVWQQVFGYGLVRTPEEFGLQGEHPTHPELLDWLAIELRESGWDMKHMLKLMVMSRTFQQESKWRQDVQDPANRKYARGPGFRLDAEVIRDTALWASGLLDKHMGGEGVKPYQPPGLWKALMHPASNTKLYVPDKDERVYRRSLYKYWKRTSPHPMMTLFDAPNRESSCVRRSRSNTPLQSLGLFNEKQRVEMARALAARLIKNGGKTDASRLDYLFELLTCRKPNDAERTTCNQLLKTMRDRYTISEADALALLGGKTELKPIDHAAWTQVANTVLASDLAILLY